MAQKMEDEYYNFEQFDCDVSVACYMTDYIFAAFCFSMAMKISKYRFEQSDFIKTSQAQYIYKILPIYCTLTAISTLLGGVFHHFPKRQYIFDVAGAINGVASVQFVLILLTTFVHIKSTVLTFLSKATKLLPLVIIGERFLVGRLNFKALLVICYLVGFLISFISRAKHVLNFNILSYRLGCILAVATAATYIYIEKGCRKPNAFANGTCIFPDWFNHNAVAHVLFMLCFKLTVKPYINSSSN